MLVFFSYLNDAIQRALIRVGHCVADYDIGW